jgi:hypothetical protein
VASGSFTAPDHEYPSYLELRLAATDSGGLSHDVQPHSDHRFNEHDQRSNASAQGQEAPELRILVRRWRTDPQHHRSGRVDQLHSKVPITTDATCTDNSDAT